MARLGLSFLRNVQASIRKLWGLWVKLQTDEDDRWKNSVSGGSTSRKDPIDATACQVANKASSPPARPKGRPTGAGHALGESKSDRERESAAGPVPTLFELVEQRQSEYKAPAAKNLSKGASDE